MQSITKILAVVTLLLSAGCIVTKGGAYREFAEDLERLKGKPFAESYVWYVGDLGEAEPIEVKHLDNGNEIRIYKMERRRESECTVLVEVNPATELIIGASSRGPDCWRPY